MSNGLTKSEEKMLTKHLATLETIQTRSHLLGGNENGQLVSLMDRLSFASIRRRLTVLRTKQRNSLLS